MRDMSTDRPDQTESAYTVDAGHFQIESDLFSYTRDSSDFESFSAVSLNLKLGLLNNVDLQVGLNPFLYDSVHDSSTDERDSVSGFGDLVTRLKINLWGNDSGPFALAIMPFVKIPTGGDELSNGSVEGGLIIPLAFALPGGWGMGLMTEFDFLRNDLDDGYHTDFVNSVTFAHDIVGSLAGYAEFFTVVSSQSDSDWQGFLDFGLTYAVTENLQLDTGINIGVTDSAPDWNPFVGFAYRY
jgi:hypothetical protein